MTLYRYPAGAIINDVPLALPTTLKPCRAIIDGILHGPEICELWTVKALAALGIKRVVADPLPVDETGWPYLPGEPVDMEQATQILRSFPNAQPDVEGSAANQARIVAVHNATIDAQIAGLESRQARPLRELALGDDSAKDRIQTLDAQIAALRAQRL